MKRTEYFEKYREENKEELKRKSSSYYYRNKEKCTERNLKWQKNNSERMKAQRGDDRRINSHKKQKFVYGQWRSMYSHVCNCCGTSFESTDMKRQFCNRKCYSLYNRGETSHSWKGGRVGVSNGYMGISSPSHPYKDKMGYVREHRLLMEKHLGRYLKPEEVVHHKNGNKKDNRIENLTLFKNQGEHQHAHGHKN